MNPNLRLPHPALATLLAAAVTTLPAAAQGQPVTTRSRTTGLEVRAHVTAASTATPGGISITVHGPPGATYFLYYDTNPASVDFATTIAGLVGPFSLSGSALTVNPAFFTVPPGQTFGTLPATGEQTLTSTVSLPLGVPVPIFWQAIIVATAATPLHPSTAVYASNPQSRLTTVPIAAPSVTGYLASATLPTTNGFERDVEQSDVDGDGDLDLLILFGNATANLYLQQSNGGVNTYAAPITLTFPGMSAANSAEFADLNDDGFDELIVGGSGTNYVVVCNNNGGTPWLGFSCSPNTTILLTPAQLGFAPNVNDIETGDVNGDGLVDLGCATGFDPCVGEANLLLLNRSTAVGRALLVDVTLTNMPLQFEDTEDMEFFDAEGDGDLDMVLGNFDGPPSIEGQNFIYLNNGAGFFNTVAPVPVGAPQETLDVVAVDIDLDGLDDLYFGNWLGNPECGQPFTNIQTDALLLNNGPGGPGTFRDYSFLLPDNPNYIGPASQRRRPWASIDAEAVRMPLDAVLAGQPIFKDYDHDGDVDIFVPLGSFGNTNPLVAIPVAGVNRGIIILQNQQAQMPGVLPLPPFFVDPVLIGATPLGNPTLPDYNDIELGDWLNLPTSAGTSLWFEKDVGAATINVGHIAFKKNQG